MEAESLIASLTEFSTRAGHDLLGPLNQASSLLALFVKRYRNQLDSEADTLLDFLQSASTRMEGVVTGVRKYMETAAAPPFPATVDLNQSLAAALARLQKVISESGAVIESDPLPAVTADADQMIAIFEILLGNAVKFRRPDAPPCIRISSRNDSENALITIADNGIGIDPESGDAVFLPFKRLNGREYPGAGLGLAIAKLIAGVNGGSILVAPTPASGPFPGASVLLTVPTA